MRFDDTGNSSTSGSWGGFSFHFHHRQTGRRDPRFAWMDRETLGRLVRNLVAAETRREKLEDALRIIHEYDRDAQPALQGIIHDRLAALAGGGPD